MRSFARCYALRIIAFFCTGSFFPEQSFPLSPKPPFMSPLAQPHFPFCPIMPTVRASCSFPASAAFDFFARLLEYALPLSAASRQTCTRRGLRSMAIAVTIISTLAAFGVARAQGTWSMTKISAARSSFAAASVGNVALFAGGITGVLIVACLMRFVCLHQAQQCGLVCPVAGF